ncbi:hypothetical protein M9Y10_001141 [Tritrichomonas musculus]|uniref:Uncharacterized protein n=1 Tax=Tritrichomonas musculus TaxID=1915356 RepID=A0ABR2L6A9_9EUKA
MRNEYSQAFVLKSLEIKRVIEVMMLNDFGDIDTSKADNILKKYKLPFPDFSSQFISSFMKRNRLSWRQGHYSRRGNVDRQYA